MVRGGVGAPLPTRSFSNLRTPIYKTKMQDY